MAPSDKDVSWERSLCVLAARLKEVCAVFSAAGPEKRRLREKADNIVGTGAIRT
jgi:hypothetical protein